MSKLVRFLCYVFIGAAGFFASEDSSAQNGNRPIPAARKSPEMAAERIADVLAQPLRRRLDYAPEQLDIVFDEIQEDYGIPIVFDKSAMDEVAIGPEIEVSISLDGITLLSALNLMFKEPGLEDLTFLIDDEVLLITTKDRAVTRRFTRVYRADDFELTNEARSKAFMGASAWADFSPIIDVVTSCVEPNSWRESGRGDGEIRLVKPDMLVITQTWHVHRQIEKLFADLRETRQKVLGNTDFSSMQPETHGFVISIDLGENPDQVKQQLAESIKKSVDWSTDGVPEQDVWIEVLPDRVLVRHIPKVLSQVEGMLTNTLLLQIPTVRPVNKPRVGVGGGGAF